MSTPERLQNYLTLYNRKYPNAWRQFDEFRGMRGSTGEFEWHDWCFCPLAGSYAIVSNGGHMPFNLASDVGILGALAAWRATQGIYRFDETVFESVWNTELKGDIPVEVLYRLPEWCCYVETPGKKFGNDRLSGFFVYLDDDRKNLRDELRFVFDTEKSLISYPLHLSKATILESLESVIAEATYQAEKAGYDSISQNVAFLRELKTIIAPMVSLTLYLCSQSSEIPEFENRAQPDYNPKQKRFFPPKKVKVWEVAFRLGSAIRQAESRENSEAVSGSDRNRPRPHIRRAHWHGFWSGPREGKQKFDLKWLPPTAINVESDLIPTFKEVK